MNKRIRKIIVFVIIISIILGVIIHSFFNFKKEIDAEVNTVYYTEKQVKDLEYLLKDFYETDHSEKEKRQMAIYYLLNTEDDYYYSMHDDIEDVINEIVNNITDVDSYDYKEPYYIDGKLIHKPDYHEIALSMLEDYNSILHDRNVAEALRRIDDKIVTFTNITCLLLYLFTILYFVLVKEFNKKTFIKDIIKYAIYLILIYVFNTLALLISEKVINYLGVYKVRAFEVGYGPNIFLYGEIYPLQLLIIFAVGVILFILLNIKRIKKVS